MPLDNPKHELFAHGLAKGQTQIEAYTAAGFKPHDSAAARLCGNVRIQERVAELLSGAAKRTEITVASLTESLLRIGQKAEALGEASGLAVARASQMDVAKLNGLIIDKAQVDQTNRTALISNEPESEAEWEHKASTLQ